MIFRFNNKVSSCVNSSLELITFPCKLTIESLKHTKRERGREEEREEERVREREIREAREKTREKSHVRCMENFIVHSS